MNFIVSLTLILPFTGFFISFFFGKVVGRLGASILTTTLIYMTMLISIYIFYNVALLKTIYFVDLFDWINSYFIQIKWALYCDSLTASMLLVVNIVSFCTHLYSIEYMEGDPYKIRFMSYLSLFTFFMIILVTASNLFQLFVGWEGVGICSYLLINFWFHRLQANKAAIMAVMTNKIGDITLLCGFCILLYYYKTLDFGLLFTLATDALFKQNELMISNIQTENINTILNEHITTYYAELYAICLLFIIGAIGKSAQVGLHIWLPEAMEGPTPVSSLIHAATMVTAGIFLIIRCSFIFEVVQPVLLWAVLIGALTSFFGSTVACFQDDIKKVIAYSTCSQLGYMFTACGYSAYANSLFHLFNHAFFKALLFLTAGYIIHAISNEQDMRQMGGLGKLIPLPYIMISIGSFALTGFPFLAGFYSKEKILELFYARVSTNIIDATHNLQWIYVAQLISTTAVIFTILYSAKMLAIVFMEDANGPKIYNSTTIIHPNFKNVETFYEWRGWRNMTWFKVKPMMYINNIHYGTHLLIMPLFILSILSIFSGLFFADMMVGPANMFWNDSLFIPIQETNIYTITENTEWTMLNFEFNKYIKGISVWLGIYYTFIFIMFFSKWSSYDFLIIHPFRELATERTNKRKSREDITLWKINIKTIMTEKYIFINKMFLEKGMSLFFKIGLYLYYILDRGLIELLGPMGIVKGIHNVIYKYEKYQNNKKTIMYLNLMLLGAILFIFIMFIIV